MQQGGVGAILEALRNTRDQDTSLDGLNQLRRGVRSEGPAFLARYLAQAGGFDELQATWDAQLTVQNYHVTVTLLLAASDVLAAAAAQPRQPDAAAAQLQAAAAALAVGILSRRMKALYFNLSSEVRGKSNAALALLAALARQGADTTRDLARLFDFSLAALPQLARPPRPRKGEGQESGVTGSGGASFWQQWRGGDALKRPSRAGFVAFALGLLGQADALTLGTLLATRPLMGGLLNHVAGDPPEVQLQVLGLLRSRVLAHKAGMPAATQAEVLSDAVLGQLSQMAANADPDGCAPAGAADEEAQQAQQASDLAFAILRGVATSPAHGLCEAAAAAARATLAGAVAAQLTPGQKRLLRWLQRLRPAESAAHMDLLKACTAADPSLAVALLLSLPFSLEPAATGRWIAHAAVAGALMQQAAALPPGLSVLARRGGRPPGADSKVMLGLLRCAVPPSLSKAALSRGLQHSSSLVRHATLCLLAHALDTVAALQQDIAAAGAAAAAAADSTDPSGSTAAAVAARGRWQELGHAVQAAARAALPDPQPLLALYHSLERTGAMPEAASGAAKAAKAPAGVASSAATASEGNAVEEEAGPVLHIGGELVAGAPEGAGAAAMELDGVEEEEELLEGGSGAAGRGGGGRGRGRPQQGLAAANPALVSAALRALVGWQRALPGALAEAHVDAERLLPQDLPSLDPHHQYLLLELLVAQQAQQAAAAGGEPAPAPLAAAALLPVLRLLGATQHTEVRALAWCWAQARLEATGAFGPSAQGEAQVWLECLPRGADNPHAAAVCSFLCDAIMQLQRRPHEFFELAQQAQQEEQAAARDEGAEKSSSSLLALCALRQALRVLPSAKMVAGDKAVISAYVAATLGTLLRRQHSAAADAGAAAAAAAARGGAARQFAHALLAVLRSEAQRSAQPGADEGSGEGRKRRKAEAAAGPDAASGAAAVLTVPGEGQCLASLAYQLEQEAAGTAALAAAEEGADGQRASKKRRKSKGAEAQQAEAVSSLVVAAAEPGLSYEEALEQYLGQQAQHDGQQAQHAAWELQHRLLCAPRGQVAAALPRLTAAAAEVLAGGKQGGSREESSQHPALAGVLTAVCSSHGLPLPAEALAAAGCEQGAAPEQARSALLAAAPVGLLLHTLMTEADASSSSSSSSGGGSGSGGGSEAAILAALARRTAGGGSGGEAGGAVSVVQQCLYWLERAGSARQVLLLFQAMQSALSCHQDNTGALRLLAAHPAVQAALQQAAAPARQDGAAAAAAEADAAVALSAVSLLQQQLAEAEGEHTLSGRLAACETLLRAVAAAFHQAAASPRAVAAGGGQAAPPAAQHWTALLPWMGDSEVQGVVGALLDSLLGPTLAPPAESDSWVVGAMLSTLRELLSRPAAVSPGLLRSCTSAMVELACSCDSKPVDECLMALVSGPHAEAALAFLHFPPSDAQPAGAARLLRACLERPTPTRAQVALALVRHSGAAGLELASSLPGLLAQEQTGPSKRQRAKDAAGEGGGGQLLLACALPAAVALLERHSQQATGAGITAAAAAAAAGVAAAGGPVDEPRQQPAAALAASLRDPLLSYFTSKRTAEAAGGASASATSADAEAPALLRTHALPCLRLCLVLRPPEREERERLLGKLLHPQGFPLRAAAGVVGDGAAADPGSLAQRSAERAAAAVVLLLARGGGGAARRPGAEELQRYLQVHAATLAALFKLPAPVPAQQRLEALLLRQLDGPIGDAVAALPGQERSTQAFSLLAEAACAFGTAVLRHRFGDVAALCTLRRFMAALLPEEEEDEEGGETGGSQDMEPGANSSKPASSGSSGSSSGSEEEEASSGSSSSSSDEEEAGEPGGTSSSGDSGSSHPNAHGRRGGQHAGPLRNPAAAAAALELLQRVMAHSRFVPTLREASASPPPLPPAAHALPRPLQSLLPLAELPPSCLAAGAAGAAGERAALKRELCELLETLLDLQDVYAGEQSGTTAPAEVQQAEAALLPLLMAGYGGSLSSADRAVWSLAQALNLRLWRRAQRAEQAAGAHSMRTDSSSSSSDEEDGKGDQEAEGDGGREAVAALLEGPLSKAGFAWGPAATALQAAGLQAAGGEDEDATRRLLQSKLTLDPLRCALAAVHFPEWRALSGQGASAGAGGAPDAETVGRPAAEPAFPVWLETNVGGTQRQGPSAGPPTLPYAESGQDPAFLLPFCVVALRQRLVPARGLLQAGALSLCLRALAAEDAALRGLAYEAVALLQEQLEQEEFRERRQLSVLLAALRGALTGPFQRLPAVTALFLAEAAMVLAHPGTPMYTAVNKYLLRRGVLDLKEVPLFGHLMLGGSPQHTAERRWLLQLLLGGLRGPEDARAYRRRYVLELAMSLHDASVADPSAARLALALVCRATYVPRAARQLTAASGLVPWLATVAASCLQAGLSHGSYPTLTHASNASGSSGAGTGERETAAAAGEGPLQPARDTLAALLRLTRIRAVARPGAREVLADLAAAAQQVHSALCSTAGAGPTAGLVAGGGVQELGVLLAQLIGAVQGLYSAGRGSAPADGPAAWLEAAGRQVEGLLQPAR